jgi:hypothetical protein
LRIVQRGPAPKTYPSPYPEPSRIDLQRNEPAVDAGPRKRAADTNPNTRRAPHPGATRRPLPAREERRSKRRHERLAHAEEST